MSFIKSVGISLLVMFSLSACSEAEPQGTKVLDGEAYITFPAGYTKMSDEMRKTKFPVQTPPEAYSTADTTAAFVFNKTATPMPEKDLPKFTEVMKKQYAALSPTFTDMDIDGHKVVVLKMTTPAADGNVKNVMMFTSLNGKLTIASFNTTEKNEAKYLADGEKALMALKWKK
ncbi:hypothetical protein RHD99_15875 [Buttiauxella selenatireducens]|uniref:DUF1795 domain-containing protein n=1 Tax=Buttiauxella selenatireducens TaxID=3073902 RepID=A0ABY9S6F4_9ENTR|nr:hypothetical protein [Buttiauxella sp. R73]WMY72939.1 hypothetical protein RHD99_15875 [Buttiauxella sp. R73]